MKWREDWSATVNKEFAQLGISDRIDHRTLNENLRQAYAKRKNMGRLQSKQEINAEINSLEDTYRQSWNYYQESFGISPNEGHQEIRRLQHEYQKSYENIYAFRRTTDIRPYTEKLREFEMEYKKQRLLTEIRHDGHEILQSLDK